MFVPSPSASQTRTPRALALEARLLDRAVQRLAKVNWHGVHRAAPCQPQRRRDGVVEARDALQGALGERRGRLTVGDAAERPLKVDTSRGVSVADLVRERCREFADGGEGLATGHGVERRAQVRRHRVERRRNASDFVWSPQLDLAIELSARDRVGSAREGFERAGEPPAHVERYKQAESDYRGKRERTDASGAAMRADVGIERSCEVKVERWICDARALDHPRRSTIRELVRGQAVTPDRVRQNGEPRAVIVDGRD